MSVSLKWIVGCALLALVAAPGAAQDANAPVNPEDTNAEAGQVGEQTGQEIIVTAQKRTERLQDVPLTVTVVSGETLQRRTITNLTDLQNTTPELNYIGQPSASYSIRGSGTQTFTRSSENNVLLVLDGVIQGQLTPPTSSLFDVERVEVLSGPQGMLFGKNASAGVINIITASPRLGETELKTRLTLGEDGYATINGLVNAPLGDKAALRVTSIHDRRDGFLFNRFNNQRVGDRNTTGVRGKFRWEPTQTIRLDLIGDYELERGGNTVWSSRIAAAGNPNSIAGRLAVCGVTPGPNNTDICIDGPSSRRIKSSGVSAQIDLDVGDHVLTNIAAYRRFTRASNTDSDTRPINALNENFASDKINQLSNELRIASPSGGRVEYVAGLFLYDYRYRAQLDQSGTLGALPFIATASTTQNIVQESKAIFGQATFKLTDQFNLIAGGRYTWDLVGAEFISYTDPTKGIRFSGFGNTPGRASQRVRTENFSWRLGAQFKPSPDATLFATVSRGYKGPALNNPLAGGIAPLIVQPEIPTNYEAGVKTALFDRRLNLDFTVYRMNVKDFQAQTAVTLGGLTQFVFTNASKLTFTGAQVNAYARLAEGLSFTGGVNYNRARYGSFLAPCNAPFLTGCAAVPGTTALYTNVQGNQLPGAPKWKLTATASYERPLTGRLKGFVDGGLTYRSSATTSASPDPNLVINGYASVDARLGVRAENDRWSIALFARNLTNERFPTLIFRDPLSPNGNYNHSFGQSAFRTLGITVDVGL